MGYKEIRAILVGHALLLWVCYEVWLQGLWPTWKDVGATVTDIKIMGLGILIVAWTFYRLFRKPTKKELEESRQIYARYREEKNGRG